jgi:dihydrodipicolinate synthase/N-acetylneuraminate lyase
MQTSPVNAETLARSVVSVPPLARNADLSFNRAENEKIIRHIEKGGISALLYGGNANFYHIRLREFESLLSNLAELAAPDSLMIPSVGPAYGVMMDQAKIVRQTDYPTVMVLPQQGVTTSAGVATGIRHFVEASGKPALLYIKFDGYLDVADVHKLVDDKLISVIKYATVRDNTAEDDYLRKLVDVVDPRGIMSGIGEQPAIIHLRDFGLGGFTSGCVCVAPKLSMDTLRSIQKGEYDRAEALRKIFEPLEDLRNGVNPIRVLHEAVRLAGIADTGPALPLLTNLEPAHHAAVEKAAKDLLAQNG